MRRPCSGLQSPSIAVVGLGRQGSGAQWPRDMATSALVLCMLQVLFKMLNRGVFDEINGCVSTGKEANVYHATARGPEGEAGGVELAIKVYKTAILVFKDRDRWVGGCT